MNVEQIFDFFSWYRNFFPTIDVYEIGYELNDYLYLIANNQVYLIFLVELILTIILLACIFNLFKTICYAIWSVIK